VTLDGVLVQATPQLNWAWFGIRLTPAALLSDTRAYPDVSEPQRRAEALTQEQAWLAAQWSTAHGARWELRYTNDPLRCVLLGRTHAVDPATAESAAAALRTRLATTPRHVRAEPIDDPAEVGSALAPSGMDPRGCHELRKRLAWSVCTRPETGRKVCFAVTPLAPDGRSWEPVWQELARSSTPTVLSVYLEPYAPPPGLTAEIGLLAQEYSRLAAAGQRNPLWTVTAPPDQFAMAAAPAYAEAARRYTGHTFRLRISIAAAGPIRPGFPELVAATVGGGVVCRPPASEIGVAWRNMAALNRDWLDETYRQGSPAGLLSPTEQILTDLVDLTEAAGAFRLPYEIDGHLPLFTATGAGPRPAAPSVRPARRDPGAPTFER